MTMDTANNPHTFQVGDTVRLNPGRPYPCQTLRENPDKDFTVTEVNPKYYGNKTQAIRLDGVDGMHPVDELMLSPVQKPKWQTNDMDFLDSMLDVLEKTKGAALRSGMNQEMVSIVIGIFDLKGVSDAVQAVADANTQVVGEIDEAMVEIRAYMKEQS